MPGLWVSHRPPPNAKRTDFLYRCRPVGLKDLDEGETRFRFFRRNIYVFVIGVSGIVTCKNGREDLESRLRPFPSLLSQRALQRGS